MGMTLIAIGIGWALLGMLNLVTGTSKLQSAGYSDAWLGFAVIFNMFLFVLPGLGLAGIGSLVRRRRQRSLHRGNAAMQSRDVKQCPFCAETIKREATICRYCRREVSVNVLHDSDRVTGAITDASRAKETRHISSIAVAATCALAGLLGSMGVWFGVMLWAPRGPVQDVAIGLYVVAHERFTAVGIPAPHPHVVIRYFLGASPSSRTTVPGPATGDPGATS